jgi:hypothetical protein
MNNRSDTRPWFLFLLPVFFVFHGYIAHVRLIRPVDCLPLLAGYVVAALVPWVLIRRLLEDKLKAALIVFVLLAFYLFFGNIRDLLRDTGLFLYHYSLLLPFLVIILILLTRVIIRHPRPIRLARFLNLLLVLFILANGLEWTIAVDSAPIVDFTPLPTARCDSCPHPDIYLLLFDEYTGSRTLLNTFHYDNSRLDSFLRSEDFHILPDSRSNYPVTPFSMASMLNLGYLHGIRHPRALEPDDYVHIFEPIGNNKVVDFLSAQGYSILNYSPFDLAGNPAHYPTSFFPAGPALISYRTLPDCLQRDIPALAPSGKDAVTRAYQDNEKQLAATIRASDDTGPGESRPPKFVYMHVLMPHEPFLFDSLFHRRDIHSVQSPVPRLSDYLGYLPYTNARIRQLITSVRKNTGGKAVILFLSDHGFRYWPGKIPDSVYFRNQNAVYFPDGDYTGFYDSMSNVNLFRVVFHKLFRLDLPLLRDSTVLLLDKTN